MIKEKGIEEINKIVKAVEIRNLAPDVLLSDKDYFRVQEAIKLGVVKGIERGQNSQKEKFEEFYREVIEIVLNDNYTGNYMATEIEKLKSKIKGDDLKNEIIKIVTEDLDLGKEELTQKEEVGR